MLKMEFAMPQNFEEQLKSVVMQAIEQAIPKYYEKLSTKEWMNLREGCEYAGISYNTFNKFREQGLKIVEIDGVRRVSKKEIDRFFEMNAF